MAYTDTNVNDLIINKLSRAQYDALNASGDLSDTELYYITDDDTYVKLDNLKTINGQSLVGTGDITISGGSGSGAGIDDSKVATDTTYSSSKITTELGKKQDTLTSGTNIKTINGQDILGSGNIQIDMPTDYYTKEESYSKQEIDNKLSSAYRYIGSVESYDKLPTENLSQGNVYNVEDTGMNYAWTGTKWDALGATFNLDGKQDKLVSGTNIKTINGQDILGSGNIEIQAGSTGTVVKFIKWED